MKLWIIGLVLMSSSFIRAEETPVLPWSGILPFSLPLMNGDNVGVTFNSLDNPGGIFVIEAYFLNCPYCNDNAPKVSELASRYANEPRVTVLDVGVDRQDSQYEEWIRRHNPKHGVLKDSSRKVIGKLGTSGYPSTYVVDCYGNVVFKTSGAWQSNTQSQIQAKIDELLKLECYL